MPAQHDLRSQYNNFGSLLKHLRKRARLTQKDLSIAVGYSESQISRLESSERTPDVSAITALFVPALGIDGEPEIVANLLALADNQSKKNTAALFDSTALPRKGNLPKVISSFVGRAREMGEVCDLLNRQEAGGMPAVRLLTLTGLGGIGKTRLAVAVGEALEPGKPDGVWMVEFAPLADPDMVTRRVMQVFGLLGDPSRPDMTVLMEYLRSRPLLLILDNCEHLIEVIAEFTKALLEACPWLQILTTSREPLAVLGEVTYRVPSLTLPDGTVSFDLEPSTAVRLFVDRAQAVRSDFSLTSINLPRVAQICRRLDGIPLAIELAAARMNVLSVEAIAARLDNALPLLTTSSRVLDPRQQSLRATVAWSFNLLSRAEQKLLMRLSIFAGRWTLEAAETICANENTPAGLQQAQVLDLLEQLIKKSLVLADTSQSEPRYQLHEIIRQYAQEQLHAADDFFELQERYINYYMHWCVLLEPQLRGPDQVALLDRLEEELDNIRAAFSFALRQPNLAETGLRLAAALRWFWNNRNHHQEGVSWLEQLLAACPGNALSYPVGVETRARALVDCAFLRHVLGKRDSQLLLEESCAIYQTLGGYGKAGLVWLTNFMEVAAYWSGDQQRGRQLSAQALALAEELGDEFYLAEVLDSSLSYADSFEEELQIVNRSLSLRRSIGDVDGIFSTLFFRSHIYSRMGDYARALQDAREALKYAQTSKNQRGISRVLFTTGWIFFEMGEIQETFAYFQQAFASLLPLGDATTVGRWHIQAAGGAAWLEATTGQDYGAQQYLEAALEIAHRLSNITIEAEGMFYMAELAGLRGERQKAEAYIREAGALFAKIDGPRAARLNQYALGKAALLCADWQVAGEHFLTGLRSAVDHRISWEILHNLAALAVVKASCAGEEELAARLQGTVDAMRPATHIVDFATNLRYLPFASQTVLAPVRSALGETRCAAAYAKGQSMTLEQAAASVLA